MGIGSVVPGFVFAKEAARRAIPFVTALVRGELPAPGVKTSVGSPATPNAPKRTSFASVVVAVDPDDGVVLAPLALAVLSRAAVFESPENSLARSTRPAAFGCVTVMRLPIVRALTLC